MWLMVDSAPESAPHVWHYSTLGQKHNPTLLTLWVLIYFHINPLLQYLTSKVSNITPSGNRQIHVSAGISEAKQGNIVLFVDVMWFHAVTPVA